MRSSAVFALLSAGVAVAVTAPKNDDTCLNALTNMWHKPATGLICRIYTGYDDQENLEVPTCLYDGCDGSLASLSSACMVLHPSTLPSYGQTSSKVVSGSSSTSSSISTTSSLDISSTSSVASSTSSTISTSSTAPTPTNTCPFATTPDDPDQYAACNLASTASYGRFYLIGTYKTATDYQYCAALCLQNENCMSFAFDVTDGTTCNLYTNPVFDLQAYPNPPPNNDVYHYFDATCFTCTTEQPCSCSADSTVLPADSTASCGTYGLSSPELTSYYVTDPGCRNPRGACGALCLLDDQCLSFSSNGQRCYFYGLPASDVILTSGGEPWDAGTTAWQLYDKECKTCFDSNRYSQTDFPVRGNYCSGGCSR